MKNYSKEYNSIEELAAAYRPMHYKFVGFRRNERLPKAAMMLKPTYAIIRQLKILLGLELTYFDLRASLTPEQRKKGDMQFLTHFDRSHAESAENASRAERARYYWLKIRYLPEIMHINDQLYDKNYEPILDLPESIDMYLLRWGYLLSVPPDFVELVHGTDGDSALHAIESLM